VYQLLGSISYSNEIKRILGPNILVIHIIKTEELKVIITMTLCKARWPHG